MVRNLVRALFSPLMHSGLLVPELAPTEMVVVSQTLVNAIQWSYIQSLLDPNSNGKFDLGDLERLVSRAVGGRRRIVPVNVRLHSRNEPPPSWDGRLFFPLQPSGDEERDLDKIAEESRASLLASTEAEACKVLERAREEKNPELFDRTWRLFTLLQRWSGFLHIDRWSRELLQLSREYSQMFFPDVSPPSEPISPEDVDAQALRKRRRQDEKQLELDQKIIQGQLQAQFEQRPLTPEDYSVRELETICANLNLSSYGNKAKLIERIQEALLLAYLKGCRSPEEMIEPRRNGGLKRCLGAWIRRSVLIALLQRYGVRGLGRETLPRLAAALFRELHQEGPSKRRKESLE